MFEREEGDEEEEEEDVEDEEDEGEVVEVMRVIGEVVQEDRGYACAHVDEEPTRGWGVSEGGKGRGRREGREGGGGGRYEGVKLRRTQRQHAG